MKNYYTTQFWGTPLDYIHSAYVEFSFACVMNFYVIDWASSGIYMSNTYMLLHALTLLAYPVWLYFFLSKNYHKLGDKEFAEKYGNAYGKIRHDSPSAIWHPILYVLRRLMLALICVCLIHYPVFQFVGLFTSQIMAVIVLGAT